MLLTKSHWIATVVFSLLFSGLLSAANQDDIDSDITCCSRFFCCCISGNTKHRSPDNHIDETTNLLTSPPNASSLQQRDQLLEQLMRERDEALKKAQEAENRALKQTQEREGRETYSNQPVNPQPSSQGPAPSPVAPQPVKPSAPRLAPSPAVPKSLPASAPIPQAAPSSIPRPLVNNIPIPEMARSCKDIYEQFVKKGKLIYLPTVAMDAGRVELPISALADPLDGTFNLSKCGEAEKYLSISTGYRKGKKWFGKNDNKVEIWLTPRFLAAHVLHNLPATHYLREVMPKWDAAKAPVGIFWTWGGWDDLSLCDYKTDSSMDKLSTNDLDGFHTNTSSSTVRGYRNAEGQWCSKHWSDNRDRREKARQAASRFIFKLT